MVSLLDSYILYLGTCRYCVYSLCLHVIKMQDSEERALSSFTLVKAARPMSMDGALRFSLPRIPVVAWSDYLGVRTLVGTVGGLGILEPRRLLDYKER